MHVTEGERLGERFEAHRSHLRAVAYRMLGSVGEADDAVQETWLRLSRSEFSGIANFGGWLTTAVARVCLDALRARQSRHEEPFEQHQLEPIVAEYGEFDPENEALIADSVGLALLIVLETLTPAERVAFVLHDVFAVPFDEVAAVLERSPEATRQLASRARRRVRRAPVPDTNLDRQRQVVDAFLTASREGDFDALLAVLDPDVVRRSDRSIAPGAPTEIRGASAVAAHALAFTRLAGTARPAVVDGAAGFIVNALGHPFAVIGCIVRGSKIVEMDVIAVPERLRDP